jgi:hypothetical protein
MKKLLTTLVLSLLLLPVSAQQKQTAQTYADVLAARSTKIVQTLGITDSTKYHRVVDYLVNHYATVGRIQDVADSTVKALRLERLDKEELELRIKAFQAERDAKLYAQHALFQAQLQGELSPEQVEGIKNGLTYNVLNVTYKATLEMIPTLKEDEKRQIWIWLLEAREHAIDASSSDAKHGWFGKYKGRINNYLAARGYDLTKERAAWAERIKQQKTN